MYINQRQLEKLCSEIVPQWIQYQKYIVTTVGVSRGYTDYYQGRGQAIRPTATFINIHEPLYNVS